MMPKSKAEVRLELAIAETQLATARIKQDMVETNILLAMVHEHNAHMEEYITRAKSLIGKYSLKPKKVKPQI
jgi:hypothetical protein